MTTWSEVTAHVRATRQLAKDEADWLGLFIKFGETPTELQRLKLEHHAAFQLPWVVLTAEICREARLPPRDALAHNLKPAFGAIALAGEHYVYRCALRLDTLDLATLDLAMDFVAREAMLLRKQAHGRRDGGMFAEFVD